VSFNILPLFYSDPVIPISIGIIGMQYTKGDKKWRLGKNPCYSREIRWMLKVLEYKKMTDKARPQHGQHHPSFP
jgi:hypothetical protein